MVFSRGWEKRGSGLWLRSVRGVAAMARKTAFFISE